MDDIDKSQLEALRQQNIGRYFQRAARAYSDLALEKLRGCGHEDLGLFHTALISNLDIDGTRISTLATRAGITKQAMGQLVSELEEKGFIQRQPDPTDKRASIIHFTERGWQFLQDAFRVKLEIESEYAALIGQAEFEQLRTLLEKLLAAQEG
jgi:DNA-binding MarR family transcriptional regulator